MKGTTKHLYLVTVLLLLASIVTAGSYSSELGDGETKKKAWKGDWDGCTTATISCSSNEYLVGEEERGSTDEYSDYQCRPQWYMDFVGDNSCTSNTRGDYWLNLSKERNWTSGTLGGSVSRQQCGAQSGGGDEARAGVAAYCVNPSVTPILQTPSNGTKVNGTSANLTAEFNDPTGESGTIYFYNAENNNLIGSCSAADESKCSVEWKDLANGDYRWYTRGNDSSSISDKSVTRYFRIGSNTAPSVSLTFANNTNRAASGVELKADIADPEDMMNITFYDASDDSQIGEVNNKGNGTYSVDWAGLSADQTYNWYAEVTDGTDTVKTSTAEFTTIDVDLSWTDNSDNEDGFNIYSNSSGTFQKVGQTGENQVSLTDHNQHLEFGKYTCYQVTSYNKYGESDPVEGCLTP